MGRSYMRVDARVASPVYLAVFMIFHSFLAVLLMMRTRKIGTRAVCGAMLAFCLFTLYATGTRIAYFGVMVGLAVAVALVAFLGQELTWRKWAQRATVVMAVLGVVLVVFLVMNPPFLKDLPVLNRLVAEEVGSSSAVRLALWKMTWLAFLENRCSAGGKTPSRTCSAITLTLRCTGRTFSPGGTTRTTSSSTGCVPVDCSAW